MIVESLYIEISNEYIIIIIIIEWLHDNTNNKIKYFFLNIHQLIFKKLI